MTNKYASANLRAKLQALRAERHTSYATASEQRLYRAQELLQPVFAIFDELAAVDVLLQPLTGTTPRTLPPRFAEADERADIQHSETDLRLSLTPDITLAVHVCRGTPGDLLLYGRDWYYYGTMYLAGRSDLLWGAPLITADFALLRDWVIRAVVMFEKSTIATVRGRLDAALGGAHTRTRVIDLTDREESNVGIDP